MNLELVKFFLSHLEVERRVSPYTLRSYSTDLQQFYTFFTQGEQPKLFENLQSKDIRLWIVALSEKGLDNKSINRKLAALRTFFNYLQRTGKIVENPMVSIKMVKTKKSIPHFIRESELATIDFSSEERSFASLRDELIFTLFYGTGMRLSELIQLTIQQIDFFQRTLRVLGKRNKERIIPAPAALFELIEEYLKYRNSQTNMLLVTDDGKPLYPMFVQRTIKRILSKVSTLEKLSPHVLRHTYATHLLNKGADLNAIKELLGHANLAATQVYTHNSLEKMKAIYKQAHPKGE